MYHSKRGNLNISVEAIIILILAITMLGLGLGFIRKYFGDISGEVEKYIKSQPDPPTPTGGNPISLSSDVIISRPGQKTGLKISVFNPTAQPWVNTSPGINCYDSSFGNIIAEVLPRTIDPGKYQLFSLKFNVPALEVNDYLCQVRVPPLEPKYYKDFTLSIIE